MAAVRTRAGTRDRHVIVGKPQLRKQLRTGTAWDTTPMPMPRIGHTGQKYHAPAVTATTSQMPIISRDAAK
jgi:hypothetical protein